MDLLYIHISHGVRAIYMFVCLGYGWVGYFIFISFLFSSVLCTVISVHASYTADLV